MANNTTVNKVVINNNTVLDLTDTTATSDKVLDGEVFYTASGSRAVGTYVDQDTTDLTQMTGTLPIEHGGTGATAPRDALISLGLQYRDYVFSPSISAGDIGTRGAQVSTDSIYYSTHDLIGLFILRVADSSKYIPVTFAYENKIYCNYYRCVTTAVTNTSVTVRALYLIK